MLVISEGSDCEQLHARLKDLTSILQALGRLAEHFLGDKFLSRLKEALVLIEKFCVLAKYSTDVVLFNVTSPMPEILNHDFIELYVSCCSAPSLHLAKVKLIRVEPSFSSYNLAILQYFLHHCSYV